VGLRCAFAALAGEAAEEGEDGVEADAETIDLRVWRRDRGTCWGPNGSGSRHQLGGYQHLGPLPATYTQSGHGERAAAVE
jgi:hypothetical protein